jgi:DNA polymerase-3 subunit epsilon
MEEPMTNQYTLEEVLPWLVSQNIRVTLPFTPRTSYLSEKPTSKLLKAAILDTETTGIDSTTDKIIELGIVVVEYSPETGQVYRVLETFNELEDPGFAIPPETIKVHQITDDMVKGKKINDVQVETLLSDVSLIIAHNAKFDRAFVEARFPFTQNKAWACSYAQVPWKSEGFGAAGLEFLAYKSGFHFNGHRASVDCHALLEVLQCELPISRVKAFKLLLENARKADIKLAALDTSFDKKDQLKGRGYRWDGTSKIWYTLISEADLTTEVEWLKSEIYNAKSFKVTQEKMDGFNRFSSRPSSPEIVNY